MAGLVSSASEEAADKKTSRKRLTDQAKQVILNVYNYIRSRDKKASETDINVRTAIATGIPLETLYSIREDKEEVVKSPLQKTDESSWMPVVDDFARDCIRREMLSFYERSKLPSLKSLFKRVKGPPVNLTCSWTILNKLVKQIGFRNKKLVNGRTVLMERDDIIASRNKYLRLIAENRNSSSPKPEIYVGELCVYQNWHVTKCCTTLNGSVGLKQKIGKGARFTIVHAGGKDGFVPGSLLLFRSGHSNKESSESITHQCFQSWFQTQLLPYIPANSVIVMDNASYHSEFSNRMPIVNSKKSEIMQWLREHNIAHDTSLTKYELLDLARKHKSKLVYVIDQMARDAGHEVLRIPLYHCHLNPIELIWAQIKSELERNNSDTDQTPDRIEEIIVNAIEGVTAEDWEKYMFHSRQVEDEYRRKDRVFEYVIERLHANINDDSSDSDSSE